MRFATGQEVSPWSALERCLSDNGLSSRQRDIWHVGEGSYCAENGTVDVCEALAT